ncbi:MAG: hypothetical protein A2X08_06015 [Bacteroidetes bacterium GWA2_32_17]|nr:MAG: hypothetical protein A2X08_06015 [Bacteroidetes bacterium GWA2_32_17]
MKSIITIIALVLAFTFSLEAANFKNLPTTIIQPDGITIQCLASGDEFFNYIHDANGYTIIQGQDGWYYYAILDNTAKVVPSQIKVGTGNPAEAGIPKGVKISEKAYKAKVEKYLSPLKVKNTKAPATGSFNNVVIYIRFADDAGMTNTRQTYLNMFTGTGGATYSVQEYFESVSYNQLTVNAVHFPDCAPTTNLSYQDANNRNYYQPYNATTNPGGYVDDNDSRVREHTLLKNAINSLKTVIEAELTAGELDMDNNGDVDNISFIVAGDNDEWSDLLWAHRWALYSFTVTINGKQVWDYNFQPEAQSSSKTTCHELFHCIGSPDLYHYYDYTEVSPASYWDLMEYGSGSMTAYMKEQIGGWLTIPEISTSGTYTLNPLASSTNNAYKIAFPNSTTEFLVLEFRKKTGVVESKLSASADEGLLIYRINTAVSINEGNRNGPPDMLWVYRPNGDTYNDGDPWNATFSSTQGRTTFNAASNPECHLSDDATWGEVSITNVGAVGATISFDVTLPSSGYNITFNISDETNPINAATVVCDGVTQGTNSSGQTIFTNKTNGTYNYSVSKTGYNTLTGTVTVLNADAVKNLVMTLVIPTTKLRDAYCGITVANLNAYILCDPVTGADDFQYNFVNTASGYNQTIARGAATTSIYLSTVPGLIYGKTYDVKVKAHVGGNWGNYGAMCQLSTPSIPNTKLRDSYCGISVTSLTGYILCDPVAGATDFQYNFVNAGIGYDQTVTRGTATTSLYLNTVPGLGFGNTYDVKVRAKVGGTWGNYGSICQITIQGSIPTTKLRDAYCGVTLYNKNTYILCDPVSGATDYQYNFVHIASGFDQTVARGMASSAFYLSTVPGLTYGKTYDVVVRAKIGGNWGTYGTMCQITLTSPSKGSKFADPISLSVPVIIYPNPFNDEFRIQWENHYPGIAEISIFDITGKKVFFTEFDITEDKVFGENLIPGIYFVQIKAPNNELNVFKLIKTK